MNSFAMRYPAGLEIRNEHGNVVPYTFRNIPRFGLYHLASVGHGGAKRQFSIFDRRLSEEVGNIEVT